MKCLECGEANLCNLFQGEAKFVHDNTPHIDVTACSEPPTSGLGLQVRRGSEPSLHNLGVSTDDRNAQYNNHPSPYQDHTKRWSAAPVCRSDNEPPERLLAQHLSPNWGAVKEEDSLNESLSNFSRSGRLSMQFFGADSAG